MGGGAFAPSLTRLPTRTTGTHAIKAAVHSADALICTGLWPRSVRW